MNVSSVILHQWEGLHSKYFCHFYKRNIFFIYPGNNALNNHHNTQRKHNPLNWLKIVRVYSCFKQCYSTDIYIYIRIHVWSPIHTPQQNPPFHNLDYVDFTSDISQQNANLTEMQRHLQVRNEELHEETIILQRKIKGKQTLDVTS